MVSVAIRKEDPDLEIDNIRVFDTNTINRPRVALLTKRKADRNDNGMLYLNCGNDLRNEKRLFIEDEEHAKSIIKGIKLAIKLKWFQKRK